MPGLDIEFFDDPKRFISKRESDLEAEVVAYYNGEITLEHLTDEAFLHTCAMRSNILEWYPFKNDARILEVGAELGALTGFLCERGARVVAAEYKPSRADVIKKRYAGRANLNVINCNPVSFDYNDEFDYIIIGGIFGYAAKYIDSPWPQIDMIKRLFKFLAPGGVILLMCDNRLGLKYFGGAVEEYSGRLFTGLNDFGAFDKIRTFSKQELLDICQQAGASVNTLFCVSPGLTDTQCIYAHDAEYGRKAIASAGELTMAGFRLFNESLVINALLREGVDTSFANAFLLELTCDEKGGSSVMYAQRRFDMKLGRHIWKVAQNDGSFGLYDEGRQLEQTAGELPPEIKCAKGQIPKTRCAADALGEMTEIIAKMPCGYEDMVNDVCGVFAMIAGALRRGSREAEPKLPFTDCGELAHSMLPCQSNSDPYITLDDIYIDQNVISVDIWRGGFDAIPVDLIMFRMICKWYDGCVRPNFNAAKKIPLNRLLEACAINQQDIPVFLKWQGTLEVYDKQTTEVCRRTKKRVPSALLYPTDIEPCGEAQALYEAELVRRFKELL